MVDVGRGRLAADVFGPLDAPPVLMIAGGGADAASWVRLVPETAQRFFVVGMSLGGMAAQHVALRSPESVRRLIPVSTIAAASTFVAWRPTEDVPVERRSFADHFPESQPDLLVHLAVRAGRTRYHSEAELAQVAIFLSHEVAGALDSIRCPTTVVCGREDRTFPVRNSQQLAEAIPASRLVELDRVGRAVHFEVSGSIADAVAHMVAQQ